MVRAHNWHPRGPHDAGRNPSEWSHAHGRRHASDACLRQRERIWWFGVTRRSQGSAEPPQQGLVLPEAGLLRLGSDRSDRRQPDFSTLRPGREQDHDRVVQPARGSGSSIGEGPGVVFREGDGGWSDNVTDVRVNSVGVGGSAASGSREDAFAAFVSSTRTRMHRWAYLVCGDWDRAEDIVQSTLVKLYLHWDRVERADNTLGFARRAVVNAAIDDERRWRRLLRLESSGSVVPDVAQLRFVDDGLDGRLAAALMRLGKRQRAVIVMRYMEDLSVEETAAALAISTGTVKSQAARGLAILRDELPAADFRNGEDPK